MKNSIGFIAIGQGGGNIGSLFEASGHTVLYANTSSEDLATLGGAKHAHHIKDGEGCHKDRDKAKALVAKDFDDIYAKIGQTLKEEFVFVVFTAGGGTGSGASPMMIDLLIRQAQKKVGAICVLPARDEPLKTHINAYECFKELEEIEGMGATFVLDNSKAEKFFINRDFADLFSTFIGMPQHHNFKGNIDAAEIKELLSTRGAAIISKISKGSGETPVTARLIQSLKQNIFAPMEADRAIAYIGLSSATDVDVAAIAKEVGTPLDVYQGKNPDCTVCALCGLTYPYAELGKMREAVEGSKETITKSLLATRAAKLSDGINFLNDLNVNRGSQGQAKADVSDVFAKYLKK